MIKTGDEYFDNKSFEDLLAKYEHALNTNQPVFLDADELTDIADYYQNICEPDKAERAINLALSLSPGSSSPLTYRIHQALDNDNIELAKEFLSQMTEVNDYDYILNHAEILLAQGLADEANSYLLCQFKDAPQKDYQNYVIDVVNIFIDYTYFEHALNWVSYASFPEADEIQKIKGIILINLNRSKEAIEIFSTLIDKEPFHKEYWTSHALAHYMDANYEEAIHSSEFAIAIDSNDPASIKIKADSLFALKNYEQALVFYERFSELIPYDNYSYYQQGNCFLETREFEKAVGRLQKALELSEDDLPVTPTILMLLAFTYSIINMPEEGHKCIDRMEEMDYDHIAELYMRAHLHLIAGNKAAAYHVIRQALEEGNNEEVQPLIELVEALHDTGHIEYCYQLLCIFYDVAPTQTNQGYSYLALCCYELKRYSEFLHYLQIASERNQQECKRILGRFFPSDMKPEDYCNYLKTGNQKN